MSPVSMRSGDTGLCWITPAKSTTALDERMPDRSRRIILDPENGLPTVCSVCQKVFHGAQIARNEGQFVATVPSKP